MTLRLLVVFFLLLGFLPIEAREARGRSERSSRSVRSSRSSDGYGARRTRTVTTTRVRPERRVRVVRERPVVVRERVYTRSYRPRVYSSYGLSGGWRYGGGFYGRSRAYYEDNYASGLKFDLDDIGNEKDVRAVQKGRVFIDGLEVGKVDRFDSWHNGHVPLSPGEHNLKIVLRDGRYFETDVAIQPGRVLVIDPVFPPVGSQQSPSTPPAPQETVPVQPEPTERQDWVEK